MTGRRRGNSLKTAVRRMMAEDQLCLDRLEPGRRGSPVNAMDQNVGLKMFAMTEVPGGVVISMI